MRHSIETRESNRKWSDALTLIAPGKWANIFLTIDMCPPRIAAYNGVHLVLSCDVHFAPAPMRQSTCST